MHTSIQSKYIFTTPGDSNVFTTLAPPPPPPGGKPQHHHNKNHHHHFTTTPKQKQKILHYTDNPRRRRKSRLNKQLYMQGVREMCVCGRGGGGGEYHIDAILEDTRTHTDIYIHTQRRTPSLMYTCTHARTHARTHAQVSFSSFFGRNVLGCHLAY